MGITPYQKGLNLNIFNDRKERNPNLQLYSQLQPHAAPNTCIQSSRSRRDLQDHAIALCPRKPRGHMFLGGRYIAIYVVSVVLKPFGEIVKHSQHHMGQSLSRVITLICSRVRFTIFLQDYVPSNRLYESAQTRKSQG